MTEREEVVAYWQELRGSRRAPDRCEIDPARLARALPRIIVGELPTRSIRLVGAALRHIWRSGEDFASPFATQHLAQVIAHLRLLHSFCQPVQITSGGGSIVCLPLLLTGNVARFLAHADEALSASITPLAVTSVWVAPEVAARRADGARPALRVIQGGRRA